MDGVMGSLLKCLPPASPPASGDAVDDDQESIGIGAPDSEIDREGREWQKKAAAKRDDILRSPPAPKADISESKAVQVICRCRPLLDREKLRVGRPILGATAASHAQFDYEAVCVHGPHVYCLSEERHIGAPTGSIAVRSFPAHAAFGPNSSTHTLYLSHVQPLVAMAKAGGRGTVIAYGQTGSGKTYTMTSMQRLAAAELLGDGASARLSVSFFENMGDKCRDLLQGSRELVLREDASGEVRVAGLHEEAVDSLDAFTALLAEGNARRCTKPTKTNDHSSRSHAICTLTLLSTGGGLLLVDLAGSERREDAVDHSEERIREMRDINASLSTLKECIRSNLRRATVEPTAHVPYRQSKLTMLLRSAFETSRASATEDPRSAAQSAVCFIAHISPLRSQAKHTINTLDYAAQMIQATMAERQRAQFDEVERWPSKKLVSWVSQLDDGKYAHCAHAFARCTGKMLTVEYEADVAQWVVAAGGSEEDAHRIYTAFRELHKKAKAHRKALAAKAALPGSVAGLTL